MGWNFLSYLVELKCGVKSYDSLSSEGYGLDYLSHLVELTCGVESYDSLSSESYGLEFQGCTSGLREQRSLHKTS
jgi:hypothetical protein